MYTWLLNNKQDVLVRYRPVLLGALSWAVLILFHFASVLSMADAKNPTGFGWNYMNFQVVVIIFALFDRPPRHVVYSLLVLLTIWYWWMPRVTWWLPIELGTVITMWLLYRYSDKILAHAYIYYPFCYLFALPFYIANLFSLKTVDYGWPWLLANYAILTSIILIVQRQMRKGREHQAVLVTEATIDELTQLNNFRVFDDDLQADYAQLQENGTVFALYTFDIDHFKRINDEYGHLVGNDVLHAVAKRLAELGDFLPYDTRCYRTGGDEFTFILNDIQENFATAVSIARMVKNELEKLQFTTDDGETFSITISMGQDRALAEDQNYLDVYNRADKYLYNSKNKGRNAITVRGIMLR